MTIARASRLIRRAARSWRILPAFSSRTRWSVAARCSRAAAASLAASSCVRWSWVGRLRVAYRAAGELLWLDGVEGLAADESALPGLAGSSSPPMSRRESCSRPSKSPGSAATPPPTGEGERASGERMGARSPAREDRAAPMKDRSSCWTPSAGTGAPAMRMRPDTPQCQRSPRQERQRRKLRHNWRPRRRSKRNHKVMTSETESRNTGNDQRCTYACARIISHETACCMSAVLRFTARAAAAGPSVFARKK